MSFFTELLLDCQSVNCDDRFNFLINLKS